jgi:tetratricopeptide (TPR) repeat protein
MRTPTKQLLSSALGIVVIAICGALRVAPGAAAEVTADSPRVSAALSPTLRAARQSLAAQNYADTLAKLKQAAANPNRTPYDEHVIHVLAGAAYARTGNYSAAAEAFEAQLNDGFLTESEIPRITEAVAQLTYTLENYEKAAEFGTRALQAGVPDDEIYTIVSQAYYLNGQFRAVRNFLEARVDTLDEQGREVPQQYLQLIIASCTQLADSACVNSYSLRLKGRSAPPSPRQRRKPIDSPLHYDNSPNAVAASAVNE